MSKHSVFMVFRVYSSKERADPNERNVYYGWSHAKSVVLAFLKQRSKKKYQVQKMNRGTIERIYGEEPDDDTAINFVPVKSATTGETVNLFMTKVELLEAEKKIQRLFAQATSLDSAGEDIMEVLELFVNLDPYYGAALYYLGFRPRELDDLFPSADYHDDYGGSLGIEETIESVYQSPGELCPGITPAGQSSVVDDISKKIIYSLESFVKVLRDDM